MRSVSMRCVRAKVFGVAGRCRTGFGVVDLWLCVIAFDSGGWFRKRLIHQPPINIATMADTDNQYDKTIVVYPV